MVPSLREMARQLIKAAAAFLLNPTYRRTRIVLKRTRSLSRFTPGSTDLAGKRIAFVDGPSFAASYHQIFERHVYIFESSRKEPRILDCGANIGLPILYWKSLFPTARITAFEPDPGAFSALQANVRRWHLDDVDLIPKAVWIDRAQYTFVRDKADAGRLIGSEDTPAIDVRERITVETVRLRDLLVEPVDLLKLDVEGAEVDILEDCADQLGLVDRIFVEYHSFEKQTQRFHDLVAVLAKAGFRIHVQPELVSRTPFLGRFIDAGMDQRLNLFAFREESIR